VLPDLPDEDFESYVTMAAWQTRVSLVISWLF
jgi:hypothetical protein